MADELGDVFEGFLAFGAERGDDRAAAGVGGQRGSDAGGLGGLLDDLGDGLAEHNPPAGVVKTRWMSTPP